ncbi:MAG: DUF2948 family protein [Alphaproteobacteria bacterium]|nr:DUF2948 family protein [Alphaproteobacteria bacterium]
MTGDALKLRMADAEDLAIAASCLQDAIVPIIDMRYLADERRFVMVLNRFLWEQPAEQVAGRQVYGRTLVLLSIETVGAIQVHGIDQKRRDLIMELLTIRADGGHIELIFAGGGRLRLQVDGIQCFLEDLQEAWPTRWRPTHAVDESEEPVPPSPPSGGAGARQ